MKDTIGVLGMTMIAAGVFNRYGWDVACIIVGGILLALTVIGALRK